MVVGSLNNPVIEHEAWTHGRPSEQFSALMQRDATVTNCIGRRDQESGNVNDDRLPDT